MTEIISKPGEIEEKLSESLTKKRKKALKDYLSSGGVIKLSGTQIIYPTTKKLKKKRKKNREERKALEEKKKKLDEKKKDFKKRKILDTVKKATDPLYWEHHMKMLSNDEYKEKHDKVNPPMHMMHKPKWRKRLKMFVKSEEYRERLHEAKTSEIGEKLTGMNQHIQETQDFNLEMIERKEKKVDKKLEEINKQENATKTLLKWLKER